ncbi:hypothetical protein [Albimonas pacifica]|uniref:Uncharacterized protein n=1 Tax=Albimonas pacifica TaxID=1114924 RepID=A0A1I3CJR5_9RHOB|nr:hypothetical protein [Albimonas pacifica]SFH74563.1 hypothetical protein SAMN05216258_10231 [Albimonas pacifica]
MGEQPFQVDFPFRGSRDYVHSASLCNEIDRRFPQRERLELVLRSWMRGRVAFTPLGAGERGEGAGQAKLRIGGEDRIWTLAEVPSEPGETRVPYDEDGLVAQDPVTDGRITCRPHGAGSFFDRLIAANKKLINHTLNPGVKLIAAKVVVDGAPGPDAPFTLVLASHMGVKIFKSRILIGDSPIGELVYYGG